MIYLADIAAVGEAEHDEARHHRIVFEEHDSVAHHVENLGALKQRVDGVIGELHIREVGHGDRGRGLGSDILVEGKSGRLRGGVGFGRIARGDS